MSFLDEGSVKLGMMKVLVLVSDCPYPPISGSRVRNAHLWREMKALGVDVRILGLHQSEGQSLRSHPDSIPSQYYFPNSSPFLVRAIHHLLYSYHQNPYSDDLAKEVVRTSEVWRPDVIHAEELRMTAYVPSISRLSYRPLRTATFHNVESDLIKKTGSTPISAGKSIIEYFHLSNLIKMERQVAKTFDLAFAYSKLDCERYQQLYPSAIWRASRNGVSGNQIPFLPQVPSKNILLLGSLSYAPHSRGLIWFIEEVIPKLPETLTFTFAGSGASPEIRNRISAIPHAIFIDTPLDLEPLYRSCSLVAVPLWEGSGTRTKILESLAYGRVVVTTPKGIEGLRFQESEGVFVTGNSTQFAERIAAQIEDREGRGILAEEGRKAVLKSHDWSVVARELREAWIHALGSTGSSKS